MKDKAKKSRPHMPGYGIQPAKSEGDYLPWSFVEERMQAARNYWISSTRPNGRAHVAPVWGLWHAGAFIFGTEPNSQKARNLSHSAFAVVHLESGDDAVILEGTFIRLEDAELLKDADQAYRDKYDVSLIGDAPIFILRPAKALAWREADFPNSATR